MEFFLVFGKFCKLLYIDFSPLASYGKLRMLSAVLGSSTHLVMLRHGA